MLVRALVIGSVVLGAGCKKKEREMATELPSTPSTGHSVTHFKDAPEPEGSAEVASGSTTAPAPAIDAAESKETTDVGGKPAYRDGDGRVHGPGGPVNMGGGVKCDAEHNHCQRGDSWFFANNVAPGKLYRATACFQFEGKWYDWRGDEVEKGGKLFKTRVAKPEDLKVGTPIVFFTPESDPRDKWVDAEYEGLTSSRWDVGVPEGVSGKTFTLRGWPDPIDDDVARFIIETKDY